MDSELRLSLEELPGAEALDHAADAIRGTLAEGGSRLATLRWEMFRDTAAAALRDKLAQLDTLACLAQAWTITGEIRKLGEKTRAAPATREALALGKHKLATDLHPVVTLRCGALTLPPLRFTLKLDALVECAILIIGEGKIAALEGATLSPSATLLYGQQKLSELPAKKLPVARPYTFGNGGIPIP